MKRIFYRKQFAVLSLSQNNLWSLTHSMKNVCRLSLFKQILSAQQLGENVDRPRNSKSTAASRGSSTTSYERG